MNRATHHLRLFTIASLATALLTGCPTASKRVLVIGDSISYMSAGELSNAGNSVADIA
jgi:hypothetical protein